LHEEQDMREADRRKAPQPGQTQLPAADTEADAAAKMPLQLILRQQTLQQRPLRKQLPTPTRKKRTLPEKTPPKAMPLKLTPMRARKPARKRPAPRTGTEEAAAGASDDADAEKDKPEPLKDIDTEWEAEKICRWGAARASVIVVAPLLGSMALIANEVYMITRLADLRGIALSEGAAMGLLGSLGATFVGQSVATIIPMPALQIPLAISITYGVGKGCQCLAESRPSGRCGRVPRSL
jgi:hypothetical protein